MFEEDFFEDQDDHKKAELTKRNVVDTTERMGMILDLLPIGFMIHQQQSLLFANQIAINNLSLSQENYVGQHVLDFISDDQFDSLNEAMQKAFVSSEIQKVNNLTFPDQKGDLKTYQVIMAQLPWDGTPCIQIFMQDITEAKARENELKILSSTDYLTGAKNRRSFIEYAEQIKGKIVKEDDQHGLIVFDIDHFKAVNDTYGHEAGDEALKEVVLAINEVINEYNDEVDKSEKAILARIGGEEFAVIIPLSDLDTLNSLAEHMRQTIEELVIPSKSGEFKITSSFGLSLMNQNQSCIDLGLSEADMALYKAKGAGRNCVVWSEADFPMPPRGKRISRSSKR